MGGAFSVCQQFPKAYGPLRLINKPKTPFISHASVKVGVTQIVTNCGRAIAVLNVGVSDVISNQRVVVLALGVDWLAVATVAVVGRLTVAVVCRLAVGWFTVAVVGRLTVAVVGRLGIGSATVTARVLVVVTISAVVAVVSVVVAVVAVLSMVVIIAIWNVRNMLEKEVQVIVDWL